MIDIIRGLVATAICVGLALVGAVVMCMFLGSADRLVFWIYVAVLSIVFAVCRGVE